MTYVVSLLHFNIQYCAGGIEGLLPVEWPADEVSVEDQIIVESFVPVLEMLERHPTWAMDLEMQAYMVEVMAERHPATLDRLRALADTGQVELVSFHYSDQLWTAFPWRDQEVSLQLTRDVFEANDLPLSRVVFTQEGQFGPGMLERMPELGYDVAIFPPNLMEYQGIARTLYKHGDVLVVPGTYVAGPGWDLSWHFLNDGELYATNNMNCYLGPAFVYDPESVAEKEAELEAAEAAGARIVSIGTFAGEVGTESELPPVFDGTWQPDDTENVGLWMGGAGLWADTEQDNVVRTTNMRARHVVAAAEAMGADVTEAWKHVLKAEVSDATGWNPFVTEVEYSLTHSRLAEEAALAALGCEQADLSPTGDSTGDTTTWAEVAMDLPGRPGAAYARGDTVEARFEAGEDAPEVRLPWDSAGITTIPALLDELVTLPAPSRAVAIPLPSGILRLSEDDWLVLDTTSMHLAAHLDPGTGTVSFRDETAGTGPVTWRFSRVADEWSAVVLGTAAPEVTFVCPADEPAKDGGCGCAHATPALMFLPLLRRRGRLAPC